MGGFNVPLAVQPAPQNPGPLDLARQGLSVQTLINQAQLQKQAQQQNDIAQQSAQIQLKQQQQNQQDEQTIRSLAPQYAGKDDNGRGTFDFDGFANDALTKTGNLNLVNQLRQQRFQMIDAASKASTEQLNNELAHNKAAYEVIEGVKGEADPTQRQQAYMQGLNRLKMLGMDTTHLPANAPTDDALSAYESQLGMHGQLLADAKTHADANKANAEAAAKDWQKFDNLGVMVNTNTGETRTVAGGVMPPGMLEGKYVAIQQKKNLGQPLSPDESAFAKGYEKYKELVPQYNFALSNNTGANAPGGPAKQFGMTQEAFDQAAEKYSATGQLPAVGRGPNGIALQRALMNRAGDLHPGESLAANSSEYKALTTSLNKIQPQFEQVTAFENTAGKNLDVFLNQAKKAVDTGIPVLNLPARMVAGKLGGTDQAAFDAARTTALTEISKVLSSATAGSGVVSDSARHEVEGLIKGDATLGQIISASNILKQDMANRHQAYADQIADINQRLKQGSKAAPQTEAAPAAAPAGGAHVISINGKNYRYKGSGPTNDLKSYDPI